MQVHANANCAVTLNDGETVVVRAGDPFDRGAPIVKQHRWLFDIVEQATAAPGEKRG